MGKKWSASRVSTYSGCPLKYKYSYIDHWKLYPDKPNEFAGKGLAFHETAEHYVTGMSDEQALDILNKNIVKYEVDTEKYKEEDALKNFFSFWKEFVATKESEGYVIGQETWVSGNILRQPFCGCIDLLLEHSDNDKKLYIYDYKSAKTPSVSGYKNQLILYAYLKGTERGWSKEEIAEKIELQVFFPFAEVEGDATVERMLRCVKPIHYTVEDIDKVVKDYYVKNIQEILSKDWNKVTPEDGVISGACAFCPYAGADKNNEGFPGCAKTVNSGVELPEGFTIVKG